MTFLKKALIYSILTTTSVTGVSQAEGMYGVFMAGKSYQAEDAEPYGNNLNIDATFPQKFSMDNGNVGTLGLGYVISEQFRVEGRLGLRNSKFNTREIGLAERAGEEFILNGEIKSTTLTVEGFYDIELNSSVTPYIKAGVGVTRNSYAARLGGMGVAAFDPFDGKVDGYYDAYADEKSTAFTWNMGAGFRFELNENINLVAEYQYISLGDASTEQDAFSDGFHVQGAAAHEVQLGLQYKF